MMVASCGRKGCTWPSAATDHAQRASTGLPCLVQGVLRQDPFFWSPLFVPGGFGRPTSIKIVYWDGTGPLSFHQAASEPRRVPMAVERPTPDWDADGIDLSAVVRC